MWNALIYHIVIGLLCIIMHAAAGDAADRDLRGAGDDAPPSARSGGWGRGAGSDGGCGIDLGYRDGGARTELVALVGVGGAIGCDW